MCVCVFVCVIYFYTTNIHCSHNMSLTSLYGRGKGIDVRGSTVPDILLPGLHSGHDPLAAALVEHRAHVVLAGRVEVPVEAPLALPGIAEVTDVLEVGKAACRELDADHDVVPARP